MAAREMKQLLNNFCEGYDDLVERAPDLSAEEIIEKVRTIVAGQRFADAPKLIYSVVKGLRSGRLDLFDVN